MFEINAVGTNGSAKFHVFGTYISSVLCVVAHKMNKVLYEPPEKCDLYSIDKDLC
jgi:hypothetical protein